MIYQAGASPRGIAFAAEQRRGDLRRGADEGGPARRPSTTIRDALEAAGRDRYSARIYTLLTIITDATDEEAAAPSTRSTCRYAERRGRAGVHVGLDGHRPVAVRPRRADRQRRVQRHPVGGRQLPGGGRPTAREWTVRDIADCGAIGGLGPRIVGSGDEIADQLQEWVDETDVDGFNLAYAITPGTFEDVVEHVIPVLRERGAYPDGYTPGTLRHKLHGRGDRLPDEHRGASFRVGGTGSTSPR